MNSFAPQRKDLLFGFSILLLCCILLSIWYMDVTSPVSSQSLPLPCLIQLRLLSEMNRARKNTSFDTQFMMSAVNETFSTLIDTRNDANHALYESFQSAEDGVKGESIKKSQNRHTYSTDVRANSTMNCFEKRFHFPRFESVLSYGSANGLEAAVLMNHFPSSRVVGTDIVYGTADGRELLQSGRRNAPGAVFVTLAQAASLGPYDLITCNNVLYQHMNVSEFDAFVQPIVTSLLREGGVFMITSD